jgi:glutamine amidotransferase
MIGIIPSPLSNLFSVRGALEDLDLQFKILESPKSRLEVDSLILPGVGHASAGKKFLTESGWGDALREFDGPILGICLGAQLLTEFSEESNEAGLALVPAKTLSLDRVLPQDLSVPHMGWNTITPMGDTSKLFVGFETGSSCYFAHSYAIPIFSGSIASFVYGGKFTAVYQVRNVTGIQFHPEKSGRVGLQIIDNWSKK